MQKIKIIRKFFGTDYTIGRLFIDDKQICDTLEDTVRDKNNDGDLNDPGETKIFGKTAIPRGTYRMIINHSNHFNCDMPLLLNVVGFEGIRIHPGNTAEDTEGCILLGFNTEKGKVINSRIAWNKFMDIILSSHQKEWMITIE
jgi:hypothetical protein